VPQVLLPPGQQIYVKSDAAAAVAAAGWPVERQHFVSAMCARDVTLGGCRLAS
jgi:hypothetical protein